MKNEEAGIPMEHLFIVNPTAGKENAAPLVRAAAREYFVRNPGEKYDVVETNGKGHATEIVKGWRIPRTLRVYSCGGDGTLSEIVNGAAKKPNIETACLPFGTGNDFIRIFPQYDKTPWQELLPRLIEGRAAPVDLISYNGRYAANMCCVGLDANIGADMVRFKHKPVIGGNLSYVSSLIANIFKPVKLNHKVEVDGMTLPGTHILLCAMNGQYYGGGFHPATDSGIDDGLLDFIVVKGVSRLRIPTLIKSYAVGDLDKISSYARLIRGKRMVVESAKAGVEFALNYDGETFFTSKAEIEVAPGALKLVMPAGI